MNLSQSGTDRCQWLVYSLPRHNVLPVQKLPTRLAKDPIVEATFEYRFEGKVGAVGDLLQGVIYPKLRDRFPKVQRNPLAAFGAAFADEPTMKYQPRIVLFAENNAVAIGDRSIAITCRRPYIGWQAFKPLILEVLGLARSADVVGKTERISMKYVNLLESASLKDQFSLVHYRSSLGRRPYELTDLLTYTRTELKNNDLVSIVELAADSIANLPTGPLKGLLITVDTILSEPRDLLANPESHLERVHQAEKEVFFDVLTDAAIESMVPEWEGK